MTNLSDDSHNAILYYASEEVHRGCFTDKIPKSALCSNAGNTENLFSKRTMTAKLNDSAQRVQDFLATKGFPFTVKILPDSARTAGEAALSIGCGIAQIAKSLVFRNGKTDEPVLVIASGINRVDLKKIEKATGLSLGRADGDYVKERVGFAIGGIPPAGHRVPLYTLLDQDLCKYEVLWAAAGTPFAVFSLKPGDLQNLTGGQWFDLAQDR